MAKKAKATDLGEFVPGTVTKDEEIVDLRLFAARLLGDPAVRNALTWRAREGKLSASEFNWLKEQASQAPEQVEGDKQGWEKMMEVASEAELAIIANVLRRCNEQPETLFVRGRQVNQRDFLESIIQ